ncbi:hypothetical protein [Occultella gossypii]|uniref:Capsular polysaccharide biosynthesis protein n=1 Tax=Occultella gossypii TaxID=2800820 RepID=A0ABS7S8R4_9MICO|nr:hypothetical protein [Occultella gossypii]MBZ2196743.1 hypothetical protein [Occultella gossypii]
MDVWSITVAALRRWYILLPLLALTGASAYTVGEGVQPEYNVEGSAIVVPGRAVAELANPYGGLDDANAVLGIVLSGPETRAQVQAAGLVPSYSVVPTSRSTVLNFQVRADTPEEGLATGQMVFELAREELASRQTNAGLSPASQYGLDVLQEPSVTAVVADGKVRNMAIVGVLGAALSLLIAVLFDDIVGLFKKWRSERRERRSGQDSQESIDEPAGDENLAPHPGQDAEGDRAMLKPEQYVTGTSDMPVDAILSGRAVVASSSVRPR